MDICQRQKLEIMVRDTDVAWGAAQLPNASIISIPWVRNKVARAGMDIL